MLTVDVTFGGVRLVRRVIDAWSETDHPRKGGKFVKKGEGVGAANELHEKHGVTGDHVIEGGFGHEGNGKTVRQHVKEHGPKAAQELLDDHKFGVVKFHAPANATDQHYTVHDPRAKTTVASGTLAEIKKKGIYVYSKHAVAADILGSARLGGGASNNKGEHKGKTYVLKVKASQASSVEPAAHAAVAAAPAPAAKPPAASPAAHVDASEWKQTGPQMGSNPGGTYAAPDGTKHYVKQLKSKAHVESELAANALYEKLGVNTLKPKHLTMNGKDAVGTELKSYDKFDKYNPPHIAEARKHFVAHAFLANWDATGLHQDNHAVQGGKYTVVDAGGALKYRAQGGEKSDFDGNVKELDTMRDAGKNAAAHAVFGKMTNEQIAHSAKAVSALTDADVESAINAHVSDPQHAEHLIKTLKARRDYVKSYAGKLSAAGAAPAAAAPEPTAPEPEPVYHVKNKHGEVVASGTKSEINAKDIGVSDQDQALTKIAGASIIDPAKTGHHAGKALTLHSGPAPLAPVFHVKTPVAGTFVAQGTIKELADKGISASAKQIAGATSGGSHHLASAFHTGEHAGQKYVLHKGETSSAVPSSAAFVAAPGVQHYHVKSPTQGVIYSGSIEQLKAQGVNLDEQHLLTNGSSFAHHKGEYVDIKKGSAALTPKVVHETTPGSGGFAGSDDFKRPDSGRILTSTYLAHSEKQHKTAFDKGIVSVAHDKERAALTSYTGSAFKSVNGALRKGAPVEKHKNVVGPLTKLTSRAKLDDDHVLWRGVAENAKHHVTALEPGSTYHDPGFMSTSHNRDTARTFAGYGGVMMAIRARKGASGLHVGGLGHHTLEHEVVLPKGTNLRYAGRSHEGHYVFDHVD